MEELEASRGFDDEEDIDEVGEVGVSAAFEREFIAFRK